MSAVETSRVGRRLVERRRRFQGRRRQRELRRGRRRLPEERRVKRRHAFSDPGQFPDRDGNLSTGRR